MDDAHNETTDMEVLGNLEERGVCDGSDLADLVECEIKRVASWRSVTFLSNAFARPWPTHHRSSNQWQQTVSRLVP